MDSVAIIALLLIASVANAAYKPPLKIVHLGDSYSSGNGARDARGRKDYNSIPGCFRSPSNWGSHFANSLTGSFSVVYINRACSGAVLHDITNERMLNSFWADSCPHSTFPDEEIIRQSGGRCNRYLRPQIEAIDTTTDLVLLTIGGNDVGFPQLVTRCLFIGFRGPKNCRRQVRNANRKLDGLSAPLAITLQMIRARMRPHARIVLVTYPHIILPVRYILFSFTSRFNAGVALRDLAIKADKVQRDAVIRANAGNGVDFVVLFDKTKALFDGHEAHPSAFQKNPDRWLYEFEGLEIAEWYHPNRHGHDGWGRAISLADTSISVRELSALRKSVDIAFVVDTGRSIMDKFPRIRTNFQTLLNELCREAETSLRFALITYRDFPQLERLKSHFNAHVVQTFTHSLSSIQAAIDALGTNHDGKGSDTALSGINLAIGLPWRWGAAKAVVLLSDSSDSGLDRFSSNSHSTVENARDRNSSSNTVRVPGVNLQVSAFVNRHILRDAGGTILKGTTNLTRLLRNVIDENAKLPFPSFGTAVSGRIREPLLFDAQGSFDPSGREIDLYEWDFDEDGVFEVNTTRPQVKIIFRSTFTGFVYLRVTTAGMSSVARAPTVINEEGFVPQGDEAPCVVGLDGKPLILTDTGIFNNSCTPINFPKSDGEGVAEIIDDADDGSSTARLDDFYPQKVGSSGHTLLRPHRRNRRLV